MSRTTIGDRNRERVLSLIEKGPITRKEASAILNMSETACGGHIKKLRSHGLIYRSGWIENVGKLSSIYSIGFQEDVPVPDGKKKMGIRDNGEDNRKESLAKIKIHRDWLQEWFFGPYVPKNNLEHA